MAQRRRLGRKLFKSLLPILLVLAVAFVFTLGWIVYGITRPQRQAYLVTPQSFSNISGGALKVTDETWTNRDGTTARGWLLRGGEGAPAVVFLHRYGGDRSWLFNLGIKLNETTNLTILWPDLRGHGMDPPVKSTSFGNSEESDLLAALDFLRTLKSANQNKLVADRFGVYGVELGAYVALRAAGHDPAVQVLALDSVPRSADELVNAAVSADIGVSKQTLLALARVATRAYFLGQYANKTSCELAPALKTQRVLLLAGADNSALRESTLSLQSCFPISSNLETKTDLPLTGFTLASATGEQGEAYDRPVIDFFAMNLR
ncbi:MAG: alpha/beta fold hydrolase [Pyrinomonadaceae bacterium]|nr:alpha/beta fold hydrolase [Pyrinomonadaceae bacterium]